MAGSRAVSALTRPGAGPLGPGGQGLWVAAPACSLDRPPDAESQRPGHLSLAGRPALAGLLGICHLCRIIGPLGASPQSLGACLPKNRKDRSDAQTPLACGALLAVLSLRCFLAVNSRGNRACNDSRSAAGSDDPLAAVLQSAKERLGLRLDRLNLGVSPEHERGLVQP